MARKKCPICGVSETNDDNMIKIGTRYYHKGECENEKRKQEKEAEDYKVLVQYLCNLCDVDEPNPVWLTTIKRFREDSKYTCIGIMLTLKHYFETLQHPIKNETSLLSIVPYYYQEAKEEYKADLQRRKATKKFFAEGNYMTQHKTITVKVSHKESEFRKSRMIDMSRFQLEESEESNDN